MRDRTTARRGAPTLRDIASAVGVDVSTVSKVLSGGERITVRPETRDRILETARTLRYRPNASARGLKLSRTGALGMLLPDFTNPVYAQIVRGAVRRAEELGYAMLLAELQGERESASAYRRLVHERRIDGLLVATARHASAFVDELERDVIPHVFVNRRVPGASRSVIADDEAGAALAARALAGAGHTRLGLVAGPASVDTAQRRRLGFVSECAAYGLPAPAVEEGPYSSTGGYEAARRLLRGPSRPTGIFVSNFSAAIGALAAADEQDLTVPQDLSVVTFDEADTAAYLRPALTAVRMPFGEMGARAVEELDRVLDGEPPEDVVVATAPVLVERRSLSRPRTDETT